LGAHIPITQAMRPCAITLDGLVGTFVQLFTKELKVDLRGGLTVLQSHTLVTAAPEILALVLAMALLRLSFGLRRWDWYARSG
jgi:hypothetical protein